VEAEKAMTDLRVAVSFSEKALERAIRQVALLLAHGADNNATSGPSFKALFPSGLDAELRPIGASQIAAAVALRERLNTQPAAAKVKAQVMDDFDKSLAAFKSALDAREAGDTKVSQARATESGARERFVSAYDSKDRRHPAALPPATANNKTCTSTTSPPATRRTTAAAATPDPTRSENRQEGQVIPAITSRKTWKPSPGPPGRRCRL
jgi:hypothetical protein